MRPALLNTWLREQLAQLLRLPVSDLAGEFHLLDFGLDSLMVMELISRSRKDLGVEFASPDFFATDANFWVAFLLARFEERFPDDDAETDDADHPVLARTGPRPIETGEVHEPAH